MLASAAIPTLFRSIHEAGGVYWDGLFSQNPPVRELLDTEPDEIWVIQINAKETAVEPRTILEIADRRNELSGNLSLYQELHFIERIDSLIEDGHLVGGGYKPITIRIIEMSRSHPVAAAGRGVQDQPGSGVPVRADRPGRGSAARSSSPPWVSSGPGAPATQDAVESYFAENAQITRLRRSPPGPPGRIRRASGSSSPTR